jgi:hypothetical protein
MAKAGLGGDLTCQVTFWALKESRAGAMACGGISDRLIPEPPMTRIRTLCLLLILCSMGAFAAEGEAAKLAGSATWEAAMQAALARVEAEKIDELIDRQLSPAFTATLKQQHGAEEWRPAIRTKLERLSYYYGWLKDAGKRTVEDKGDRIIVRGEYGCFAEFDKVDGLYLIGSFGQVITEM